MIIETTLALIFIFAALVMFHEFGHFIAGRLLGIRVEEFALGFGPKLLTLFKRGDTEYTIHPFPLGGFVKLAGMEPGQEDIADGFQAQPIWKRAVVIFAGPLASFVLAVAVFTSMGVLWGFPIGTTENRIQMVSPQTEASRIGLRAGDRIVKINGKKITEGSQMTDLIHNMPGKQITLSVRRNGHSFEKRGVPQWTIEYLGAVWSFKSGKQATVDEIGERSASSKAGIRKGDKLASINGKPITSGAQFADAVNANGERKVTLTLARNGKTIRAQAVPVTEWVEFMGVRWNFPGAIAYQTPKKSAIKFGDQLVKADGKSIKTGNQLLALLEKQENKSISLTIRREGGLRHITLRPTPQDYRAMKSDVYSAVGLLGFMPEQTLIKTGFSDSVSKGLLITKNLAGQLISTLTSSRIKEEIGGPIMIAKMTGSAVARGSYSVVTMLGALSLSLAFINLIPIPIVDGGQLALLLVEKIRRKRFTSEQMQVINLVGFAILALVFITVMWSDLFKLSQGLVPQ
ncbi:MAG: RIP metalloprotease RseP [Armatimonadota bacterium]|nr:RIP metalloprotease RseP [bacterium]